MLGHIYIGTIGMEGAFEAMGEGTVDVNWAKEHHSLWLEEELARERSPKGPGLVTSTPANSDRHRGRAAAVRSGIPAVVPTARSRAVRPRS